MPFIKGNVFFHSIRSCVAAYAVGALVIAMLVTPGATAYLLTDHSRPDYN